MMWILMYQYMVSLSLFNLYTKVYMYWDNFVHNIGLLLAVDCQYLNWDAHIFKGNGTFTFPLLLSGTVSSFRN